MNILAEHGRVEIKIDGDFGIECIIGPDLNEPVILYGFDLDELDKLADDLKAAVAEARFEWEG